MDTITSGAGDTDTEPVDLDRPRDAATNPGLRADLMSRWYPWLIVVVRERIDYIKAEGLAVHYDAEDLAQDTMILALRRIRRYDPGRYTFRLWLWYQARIASNRHHARELRRVRNVRRQELPAGDDESRPWDALPSHNAPDPADVTEARDLWDWSMAALADERKARILALSYRGYSFDEIGAAEGCSRFTARSHIYGALASLQIATGQAIVSKASRKGKAYNRRQQPSPN